MDWTTDNPLQGDDLKNELPHPAGACGVEGSLTHCHPEFTAEATLEFLPMFKQQHTDWFPMKNKAKKANLASAAAYMTLWQEVQAKYRK